MVNLRFLGFRPFCGRAPRTSTSHVTWVPWCPQPAGAHGMMEYETRRLTFDHLGNSCYKVCLKASIFSQPQTPAVCPFPQQNGTWFSQFPGKGFFSVKILNIPDVPWPSPKAQGLRRHREVRDTCRFEPGWVPGNGFVFFGFLKGSEICLKGEGW